MMVVEIPYDGEKNNGMPAKEMVARLDSLEDTILDNLKVFEGYLNIGRMTGNNKRAIYFACKDFRKPSKLMYQLSLDLASQ